ncbi:MAG: hypothetical protein GY851_07870 [bacterium]|nr:hypothetical protein [bacterium]
MKLMICLGMALLMVAGLSHAQTARTKPVAVGTFGQDTRTFYTTKDGLPSDDVQAVVQDAKGVVLAVTPAGAVACQGGKWKASGQAPADRLMKQVAADEALLSQLDRGKGIRDVAAGPGGAVAAATDSGLFLKTGAAWEKLRPVQGTRAWCLMDCRAVTFDAKGRLWFAAAQGAGCLGDEWTLYEGRDGLPYDDFTCMAAAPDGSVWFGTHKGAIHFDGTHWAYRQGLRWLPDDDVRAIVVDTDNAAWFATVKGLGCIRSLPMTLAEKAAFYEDEIDKYHRRTEFEYVLEVGLPAPGVKENVQKHDSDNDGLWTCMYGAGECFAYAVTKDPKAKARAHQVWLAMKQLGDVTQGGSHPAPKGFVARTILPTSGPNPNEEHYTPEKDRQKQKGDAYWKVIVPRWPTSEDGKWYWKTDTSSDELDGHYFFYALYYDLVAQTEAEKAPIRERVRELTDHMIDHEFCLVDHDGKRTRWAVYDPKAMNHDPNWFPERGLNSLSMLSYLATAEHVTGDAKYREAADMLINEYGYAQNMLVAKIHTGPGSGNHSDDEMAFMSYYNLINYEKNPKLRAQYAFSLYRYWRMEEPEMSPLFNFIFAACCFGSSFSDAFGTYAPPNTGGWLADSVDFLKRMPLDRADWRHENGHRKDILPLGVTASLFDSVGDGRRRGYRVNGKVLPPDERHFNHWNHNPWELNTGGSGNGLATGTVFTLPYYMGLHHGFIK